jgi:predicted glycosyltransferase
MVTETDSKAAHKIWIDLDNSPHVPFFLPIIEELRKKGYRVLLTARDAYQVCDLADRVGFSYLRIGKHNGKNTLMKAAGTIVRSLQLLGFTLRERPDLAVSHGSRAQLLTSKMAGIPSIVMLDYEFVARIPFVKPTWLMAPELIPASAVRRNERELMRYPGIKEDVYTVGFRPDLAFRDELGLKEDDLVVTLRPPASEAHYHNDASEILLQEVIEVLNANPSVKVIVVPRNGRQREVIRRTWRDLVDSGKLMMPVKALDGLNLIWHSDLVISGGGTMNREAAALGVPVYSIFRGQIGAVDKHLAQQGRLILLETVDDVRSKLNVKRREKSLDAGSGAQLALQTVVDNIVSALTFRRAKPASVEADKPVMGTVR